MASGHEKRKVSRGSRALVPQCGKEETARQIDTRIPVATPGSILSPKKKSQGKELRVVCGTSERKVFLCAA